jgi:hypothetical protein
MDNLIGDASAEKNRSPQEGLALNNRKFAEYPCRDLINV